MFLNKDQKHALEVISTWWKGSSRVIVLDGAGGTGKSWLVNHIIKTLGLNPLLLAPTHEALKQLKDKIDGDFLYKTIDSALGITPTTHEKDLKFEQRQLPSLWEDYNICIIDEASMLGNWKLDLLLDIPIKIIFIGHKSQLSEVIPKRKNTDKCISPVFDRDFQTVTLTIPQRNTGELWDFNNLLEKNIYTGNKFIPPTFDIRKKELLEYFTEKKEDFLEGKTKIVVWTNEAVREYNSKIRKVLFGVLADKDKYLPGDQIIIIEPLLHLPNLDTYSDRLLKRLLNRYKNLDNIYSNSKFEILKIEKVFVELNSNLYIPCYKLKVLSSDADIYTIYEPLEETYREKISSYYEHLAWKETGAQKIKKFKERRLILSCFAKILHYYAATSYRLQGATIDNIIVINADISNCPNPIEQAKHRYVACSRAKNKLMFYRGYT